MMKKLFHYVGVLFFGLCGMALLGVFYWLFFDKIYDINIASRVTYARFSEYWNGGGLLHFDDIVKLFLLFLFIPISLFYLRWLNRCKFINLILIPVEWLQNRTLKNYREVRINIKNLKIEDKKTLEQLIEERIEEEHKKQKQGSSMNGFRDKIINKINSEKKKKSS